MLHPNIKDDTFYCDVENRIFTAMELMERKRRKDVLFHVAALSKRSGTKLESDYKEEVLLEPSFILAESLESAKLKTVAILAQRAKETDFDRVEILARPF